VITVATNHAKDCGERGGCGDATFLDTLAVLRGAGIKTAGGGATLAEARRPAIVTAGGVRFAFLGYDDIAAHYQAGASRPGTAPLGPATLDEDIRAARAAADVVIVLPHWGEEYTAHPTARQRRLAAAAVEAGAMLVVGNHPHAVQAAAPLGDGYVAYALGNFIFDQDWSPEPTEGVVLEATFRGARLVAVRFLPVRTEGRLRTVPLTGADAGRVLARMMEAAARLDD
jgi:poly-gamma-glutamate synthesis protein (capsule biosynthesis protein)